MTKIEEIEQKLNECQKALAELKWEIYVERQETTEETEETEESNYGIQDRLSMILENQSEIKSDIKKILNR